VNITPLDKQYYSHFCKICRASLNELMENKCTECGSNNVEWIYYTLQDEQSKMVWTYVNASILIELAKKSIQHHNPFFNFKEFSLDEAIKALEADEYCVTVQQWIFTMTNDELETKGCECGNKGLLQLDIKEFECKDCRKIYRIVN